MKWVIVVSLALSVAANAQTEQQLLYKKHRQEKHEENKKWQAMKEECHKSFPNRRDVKHAHYDGHFKCLEQVQDAELALEKKQKQEECTKLNYGCNN